MNWIYKKFYKIEDLLKYINDYDIQRFGIVDGIEGFWRDYYLLIYKK